MWMVSSRCSSLTVNLKDTRSPPGKMLLLTAWAETSFMRLEVRQSPGIKIQYFKGEERVEATHCYAAVACEGMADELCKMVYSCRARLSPRCADPPASASSSAEDWANAPLHWDAAGGGIRNPLLLSLSKQLKSECGPPSEMLQAFWTNTHNVQNHSSLLHNNPKQPGIMVNNPKNLIFSMHTEYEALLTLLTQTSQFA